MNIVIQKLDVDVSVTCTFMLCEINGNLIICAGSQNRSLTISIQKSIKYDLKEVELVSKALFRLYSFRRCDTTSASSRKKKKIKPLYLLMLRYETCINTFSAFAEKGIYNYTYNILKNLGVTYLGTKMKVPVKLY